MILKGKIVTLRAIEEEDLEMLRDIMNDPEVEKLVVGWAYPVSKYQQQQWFLNSANSSDKRFIIETEQDGAIGLATLGEFDWKNRVAFHGIKIGNKSFRAKGFGTDTVMTIMRYAFEELQLNRLDGAIIDYNNASHKLYCGRCGWKVEGVKRQYVYKNGSYHDLQIVGILKDEYLELANTSGYWNK